MTYLNTMHKLLQAFEMKGGSDMFLQVDRPIGMRAQGRVSSLSEQHLGKAQLLEMLGSLMDERQREEYEDNLEANFSYALGESRYRVSAYWEKGKLPAAVIRRIETRIPTIAELNLPASLRDLASLKTGLVIFAGATGSGKSTSLAAMLHHRNQTTEGHIWSVEDPIEYIHTPDRCYISQREIGVDTHTYEDALQNCLRQAPDVIMIGEVRSREAMDYALQFSGTGHLCLTTLHANHAVQTLERIVNLVDRTRREALLQDLSQNLAAIVAQKLVTTASGHRLPVLEVLYNTPYVESCIREQQFTKIRELLDNPTEGQEGHSISFDGALFTLYKQGYIDQEEAFRHAVSKNNLRLRIDFTDERTEQHTPFEILAEA